MNIRDKRKCANLDCEEEEDLCETEVLASGGDGGEDLLAEDLVALVFGKIKLVEAGVRRWKPILVAVITVDIESTEAIHALQLLEAVERHLAGSSDELQQFGTLLLVV